MSGLTASSSPPCVVSTPPCSRCQSPTKIQRITPLRTGFEDWLLRCTRCSYIHQMQVVSNPGKSDTTDWFERELHVLR
jgi:hypothetical protein